jgi:hypothetical protein
MHLKNVLRQINTDSCNIHRGRSHPRLSGCSHFHFGTLMPFEGGGAHRIAFDTLTARVHQVEEGTHRRGQP